MPQVVGRAQDQHRQVSFPHFSCLQRLLPRASLGPGVHGGGRAQIKLTPFEPAGEQAPQEWREFVGRQLVAAHQGLGQKTRVDAIVGLALVDEHSNDRSQKSGIAGESAPPKALCDQQGLIHPQPRRPTPVIGQLVAFVHKARSPQKLHSALEIGPQGCMRLGRFLTFAAGRAELIRRKRSSQKIFYLRGRVRQQEVQHHREIDPDLADHVRRRGREQPQDVGEIHESSRDGQGEADVVHAATAGPAGHLMELGSVERQKLGSVEPVGVEQGNGASREVDTGGHCSGGEDGVQQALGHQGFQGHLPGGQLAGMVGAHRLLLKKWELAVASEAGALPGELGDAGPEPMPAHMILGDMVAAILQRLVAV